jgi:hypothetical protein
MVRGKAAIAILSFVLAGVGFSGEASADNGPADEIYSLYQQGDGVRVKLGLLGYGTNGLNRRVDDGPYETLFGFHLFEEDDLVDVEDDCYQIDEISCSENPEECSDCDGDDVVDCSGMCLERNIFAFLDECVPPGLVTYWLVNDGITDDYRQLTVEDVGQDCDEIVLGDVEDFQPGDVDAGADASFGDVAFEDDDPGDSCALPPGPQPGDSGCSVSGVGGDPGAGPLTAGIMCLVGLLAWVLGRQQR